MCGLLNKKEYVKEKEILDNKSEEVEKVVSDLIGYLKNYWNL